MDTVGDGEIWRLTSSRSRTRWTARLNDDTTAATRLMESDIVAGRSMVLANSRAVCNATSRLLQACRDDSQHPASHLDPTEATQDLNRSRLRCRQLLQMMEALKSQFGCMPQHRTTFLRRRVTDPANRIEADNQMHVGSLRFSYLTDCLRVPRTIV